MKIGKTTVLTVFLLLAASGVLQSTTIANPDRPEKGEWQFSPQKVWETDAAGDTILAEIADIRIDDTGNVYVLDWKINRVHVFDPRGNHTLSFGKRGEGPGEIKDAINLFVIGDSVLIPDMNKIHYFSREGKFRRSVPTPELNLPYLFLDEHRMIAMPFSSLRKEKREILLVDLKTGEKRELFHIPKVKALRYSGEMGRLMLRMPFEVAEELVAAAGPDSVWYGFGDTYRFAKLNPQGEAVSGFTVKGREREKIAPQDKTRIFESVLQGQRELPRNVLNTMADQIPDIMPYFHYLFIDRAGLLYVLTADSRRTHTRHVDVFSKQGRYLYRGSIDLDPGCSIIKMTINDRNLAAFVEDKEGERRLTKYTLNLPG
jgi:hypothetical protein